MENKPASLLVVPLGKARREIPPWPHLVVVDRWQATPIGELVIALDRFLVIGG